MTHQGYSKAAMEGGAFAPLCDKCPRQKCEVREPGGRCTIVAEIAKARYDEVMCQPQLSGKSVHGILARQVAEKEAKAWYYNLFLGEHGIVRNTGERGNALLDVQPLERELASLQRDVKALLVELGITPMAEAKLRVDDASAKEFDIRTELQKIHAEREARANGGE